MIWWPKTNEPAVLCSENLYNRQFINPFHLSDCFTVLKLFDYSIHLVGLEKQVNRKVLEMKSFLICHHVVPCA